MIRSDKIRQDPGVVISYMTTEKSEKMIRLLGVHRGVVNVEDVRNSQNS